MVDRIVDLRRGPTDGKIVAEHDVEPDHWYFQCHFQNDPVQPGCLGLDAVWQLLGFYCAACGASGSGRALGCQEVAFRGQIRPYDRIVRYEIDVRRFSMLRHSGAAVSIGDATVFVDDSPIYSIRGAKVGIFTSIAYDDYPNPSSRFARGGLMERV